MCCLCSAGSSHRPAHAKQVCDPSCIASPKHSRSAEDPRRKHETAERILCSVPNCFQKGMLRHHVTHLESQLLRKLRQEPRRSGPVWTTCEGGTDLGCLHCLTSDSVKYYTDAWSCCSENRELLPKYQASPENQGDQVW